MSLGSRHRKPEMEPRPRTLDEAVDVLLKTTDASQLDRLRGLAEGELGAQTRIWQMEIRNNFGLWGSNSELISV